MPDEDEGFESERRQFVRISVDVPIRYKFLSRELDIDSEKVHTGFTSNLGGGGMLLIGKVPENSWYAHLLAERIVLGVNIDLPSEAEPIKALCHVSWIESSEDHPGRVGMGCTFQEIPREGKDAILRYVIKAQLK